MIYQLRIASPQDSRAIGMVQLESWRTMFPDAGVNAAEYLSRFSYDEREEDWRDLLNALAPAQCVFVAEANSGQIVGFGTGNAESNPNAMYKSELAVVHVLPNFRNQRIGRQLMRAIVTKLALAGYPSLWLWTLKGNTRARALYEQLGGVLVGDQTKRIGKDDIELEITEVAYGWPDIEKFLRIV